MSPSRSKPASSATVNTDNEEVNNTVTTMEWHGSPLNAAPFYFDGKRKLYSANPAARMYIESGTAIDSRGKVQVYSVRHAQEISSATFVKGTIDKPLKARELFFGKNPIAISRRVVAPPASGSAAGTPGAPSTVTVMPTTIAELGPLYERYVIAPESLDRKDDEILRHWTDSIQNNVTKNNVIATANNSGVEFMLQQELSAITPTTAKATIGGARELQLQDLLKAGLTSASVSAFTSLLEKFDMYD